MPWYPITQANPIKTTRRVSSAFPPSTISSNQLCWWTEHIKQIYQHYIYLPLLWPCLYTSPLSITHPFHPENDLFLSPLHYSSSPISLGHKNVKTAVFPSLSCLCLQVSCCTRHLSISIDPIYSISPKKHAYKIFSNTHGHKTILFFLHIPITKYLLCTYYLTSRVDWHPINITHQF